MEELGQIGGRGEGGFLHATHPASSAAAETIPLHAAVSLCLCLVQSSSSPQPVLSLPPPNLSICFSYSLAATSSFFLLWVQPELFPRIGSLQVLPYLVASSSPLQIQGFATLSAYQNNLRFYDWIE